MGTVSEITGRRAVLIGAFVACLVFVHASRNRWALDDEPIIETNAATHSIGAAARAFFSPYWPPQTGSGGLYRPAVILSYGLDWSLSGGNPTWFHAVNILLHGAATALVVALALAWLTPPGALAAGLLFAVHPLHVEAVANVVGRAESLAAVGLLGLILLARRYRGATARPARAGWLTLALLSLTLALFTKEHAVIAVALVALDQWCSRERDFARSADLYFAIAAVTIGWLYLWSGVAGGFVALGANATLQGLHPGDRALTMLAVQPEVVRLLTWPMDLAADYNPQVIPRRTTFSVPALIGLLNVVSITWLGLALVRRAPAVGFGILAAIIAYSPTSNVLFPSGVVLGERTLYLAVLAPALGFGWIVSQPFVVARRRWAIAALAVVLASLSWRTVTRVPVWGDSVTVLAEDFVSHPENYRTRIRMGSYERGARRFASSLAEVMAGVAIFPEDPFTAVTSVPRAAEAGFPNLALSEARRAYAIVPQHPRIARLLARAYLRLGLKDSATTVARRAMQADPDGVLAARTYAEILAGTGAPAWQRHLADAHGNWRVGWLAAASESLGFGVIELPDHLEDAYFCWDLEFALGLAENIRPDLAGNMASLLRGAENACQGQVAARLPG
jgi:hypothetical protein